MFNIQWPLQAIKFFEQFKIRQNQTLTLLVWNYDKLGNLSVNNRLAFSAQSFVEGLCLERIFCECRRLIVSWISVWMRVCYRRHGPEYLWVGEIDDWAEGDDACLICYWTQAESLKWRIMLAIWPRSQTKDQRMSNRLLITNDIAGL